MQQVQAESDYPGCNIKLVRLTQRDNIESVVARRSMRDGDVVCNLGGLAYDSVETLRSFLNSNPSGRELVGGLVRIDGVQHETLGDEGSASQSLGDFSPSAPKFAPIYFVMTGIGRYVRHYAQAGAKQANAVLSCNLGAGAGDGLVQLVVKTRNRSGIAAGSPVLLNFGMDYDHSVVSRVFAEEASQPKRLRTMLDAYFKRLGERDAQEAAAASGEGAALAIDAASVATPAPAPATPTQVPRPSAVVPETPMPTPTQIPMLPAPTPTTLAITTPPPAPTAISPVELKLLPGEAVVGEISQPFAAKLVHKGGSSPGGASSIRLAAAVQLPGNKKVPPNTVLAVAKEGTMTTPADAAAAGTAFMWKFTKTKDVLVSAQGGPVKTLYDFLKETGATSISKHKAWKAGSVPTTVDFAGSAAGSAPGVQFVPSSAVHSVAGGQCIGRPGRAAWLGMGMALRRGVPMAHLRSPEPLS